MSSTRSIHLPDDLRKELFGDEIDLDDPTFFDGYLEGPDSEERVDEHDPTKWSKGLREGFDRVVGGSKDTRPGAIRSLARGGEAKNVPKSKKEDVEGGDRASKTSGGSEGSSQSQATNRKRQRKAFRDQDSLDAWAGRQNTNEWREGIWQHVKARHSREGRSSMESEGPCEGAGPGDGCCA